MKRFSKLFSLLAAFCVLFSSVSVLAAVPDEFLSVEDITAVWNGDIDIDWYTVYGEYKLLDSETRQNADYVIAGNAYRFLIATGSNPEGAFTWSKWDDFATAVSPFNLAYNNFVAEAVVHSAWLICSDEFKIFCANVIHNLYNAPTYYDSKVIEVNDFTNNAARGNLTFQFNVNGNLDFGTISIGNNIFNNYVLSTTNSSIDIDYYFNSSPLLYIGRDISLSEILAFKASTPNDTRFTPYVPGFVNNNFNASSDLFIPSTGDGFWDYPFGNFVLLIAQLNTNNTFYISLDTISRGSSPFYKFNLSTFSNPTFTSFTSRNFFSSSFASSTYEFISINDIIDKASSYFADVISPYLVYADGIKVLIYNQSTYSYNIYDVPFPRGYTFSSPQFREVNYYVDNSVYSPDNSVAYYYNNDLINNVVNNDYSTIDNSNRYEFFNDNYYFLSEGSGSNGGDTLVTNNNITYNYITINNNTPTPTQDFYNVKIINPEDIRNETVINENQHIINDYEFNLGDLNISTGVSSAVNNISAVFDDNVDTDQTQSLLSGIVGAFPSDLFAIVIGFLAASIIIGVIMKVISH